jgi:hypothetical protein
VHVFGDLVAFLDETKAAAVARRQRLDERAGTEYHSDARIFTGTAIGLADLLQEWQAAGLSGFRLRPAALPHDLTQLTDRLVPELRRRCLFRTRYEADTLRGPARPGPPLQPLRRCMTAALSRTLTHDQADSPSRALSGREQHDRMERPRRRQPHRVRLVPPVRADRRTWPARLPVSRRRAAAARAERADLRPGCGRPARYLHGPGRPGRGDRAHRADRHDQLHVQRAVRGSAPVRQPRPPVRRPFGVERGHFLGRLHRGELPRARWPPSGGPGPKPGTCPPGRSSSR